MHQNMSAMPMHTAKNNHIKECQDIETWLFHTSAIILPISSYCWKNNKGSLSRKSKPNRQNHKTETSKQKTETKIEACNIM